MSKPPAFRRRLKAEAEAKSINIAFNIKGFIEQVPEANITTDN